MRRHMRWWGLVLGMVLSVACGDADTADGSDGDSRADADQPTDDTDTDAEADTEAPLDTDPGDGLSDLSGTVTAWDGTPLTSAEVRVQFCRPKSCLPADTFENGAFSFGDEPAGIGALEVVALDSEGPYLTMMTPMPLDGVVDVDVDIVMPEPEEWKDLPSSFAVLSFGELSLRVAVGELEPGKEGVDKVTSRIRGATLEDLGFLTALPNDVVPVKGWALGPFDHRAVRGLTVTFKGLTGLDASKNYALYQGIYVGGTWERVGTVTVNADNEATVDGSVTHLTTLVMVEEL